MLVHSAVGVQWVHAPSQAAEQSVALATANAPSAMQMSVSVFGAFSSAQQIKSDRKLNVFAWTFSTVDSS